MFPIQPHSGLTTQVHTAQLHVLPHCGQILCAHHVLISELPWGPLIASKSRVQSRTQRTIQAWAATMNTQKDTLKILPFWLAGLPGSLDWPVSLSPPQIKVCFWSRDRSFPDLQSGLHSISIWNNIPRGISPHPALGEDPKFQQSLLKCPNESGKWIIQEPRIPRWEISLHYYGAQFTYNRKLLLLWLF